MGTDQQVLGRLAGARITATRIAEILDVTDKTARSRLAKGLNASEVIKIAQAYDVNPVTALVELGLLSAGDIRGFLDEDDHPISEASSEALIMELAARTLSTEALAEVIAAQARAGKAIRGAPHQTPATDDEIAAARQRHSDKAPAPWPNQQAAARTQQHPGQTAED